MRIGTALDADHCRMCTSVRKKQSHVQKRKDVRATGWPLKSRTSVAASWSTSDNPSRRRATHHWRAVRGPPKRHSVTGQVLQEANLRTHTQTRCCNGPDCVQEQLPGYVEALAALMLLCCCFVAALLLLLLLCCCFVAAFAAFAAAFTLL